MTEIFLPEMLNLHIGVLGTTGAGKTNLAKLLMEQLLDKGQHIAMIDPTGVGWGLRLKADGKTRAYDVAIFGGTHSDFPPIQADHGAAMGEIVGTTATPVVLDTSQMTVGQRTLFFAGFAESLLIHNRGPLYLFIDEAHLFAPQGRVHDVASGRMLHAANNLVALGRGRKIAITLISQRPAKVHKDSLTLVHALVAMKMVAPQDRDAIEGWIADQADPKEGKAIIAALPKLRRGEAFVWWPEGEVLQRRQFPLCATFDSSRGLESDEEAPELPAIDVGTIESRLAEIAEHLYIDDPEMLRAEIVERDRRIRELEQMAGKSQVVDTVELTAARQAAYDAAMGDAQRAHAEATEVYQAAGSSMLAEVDHVFASLRLLRQALKEFAKGGTPTLQAVAPPPNSTAHEDGRPPGWVGHWPGHEDDSEQVGQQVAKSREVESGHGARSRQDDLPKTGPGPAALRVLKVLAQRHPARFSRAEWATLARMKRTGGTWTNYVSQLRVAGYLDESRAGLIGVTPAGLRAVAHVPRQAHSPAERIAMWKEQLGTGPAKMIDVLLKQYPEGLPRNVLAAHVRMEPRGGTFTNYLSKLRTNGLIEADRHKKIRLAPILMAPH